MRSRSDQREQFRYALRQARETSGLSQRAVARAVGRTASAVWQWEKGQGAPDLDIIAKLEELLDLDAGTLARLLGYQPTNTVQPASVLEAVRTDPRLDDDGRELLAKVYRWLVRTRTTK